MHACHSTLLARSLAVKTSRDADPTTIHYSTRTMGATGERLADRAGPEDAFCFIRSSSMSANIRSSSMCVKGYRATTLGNGCTNDLVLGGPARASTTRSAGSEYESTRSNPGSN